MDIATIAVAVTGAGITATAATRSALRTSGMTWRAAHSGRVYESLVALITASHPEDGTRKELHTAAGQVQMTVTGPLRDLADEVITTAALFMTNRDRIGDVRYPHTIVREWLEAKMNEPEKRTVELLRFGGDIPFAMDARGAYAKLMRFYERQDNDMQEPDPEPVRSMLIDSGVFPDHKAQEYAGLLLIPRVERRRIVAREQAGRKTIREERNRLLQARDALSAAVAAWGETPPRRQWRRILRSQ
ncbi:hypothetical protein [Streptomyces sp. NPDC085665]|uniref:hypothetical protein n=1 Tax=Streptomyces sp. NPDC085665 TaxID=3365735 RepID=UPI0037D19320